MKRKEKTKREYLTYIFLIFAILFTLFIQRDMLFSDRYSYAGDSMSNYANEEVVVNHIENGDVFGFYEHTNLGNPLMNTYQPLLYLLIAAFSFLFFKSISTVAIHNTLAAVTLSLIPLSIYYMLSKFDFKKIVCGIGSLISVLTIAGWGVSLESTYNLGTVSFTLGAFFLPFALGKFHEFVYNKKRNIRDYVILSTLIALTFLSHQFLAYALFVLFFIHIFVFSIFHAKKQTIIDLIKPMLILTIISFLLVSFWLIPKFTTYKEFSVDNMAVIAMGNPTGAFTTKFFVDRLINGEILDKTNNLGLDSSDFFRWPYNREFNRLPILTILFFLGILLFFYKINKFRNKFFLATLFTSIIFLFSFDDIPILAKIVPLATTLQYIKFIYTFNLAVIIIAAYSLYWIVNIISKKTKKKIYIPLFTILIFIILASPINDRYQTAKHIVAFREPIVTEEPISLIKENNLHNSIIAYEKEMSFINTDKYVIENIPKRFGNTIYSDVATERDAFLKNVPALTRSTTVQIFSSENWLNLFDIDYIITSRLFNQSLIPHSVKLAGETDNYLLYKNTIESDIFQFSTYKPILAVVEDYNDLISLEERWINSYENKILPILVYSYNLDPDLIKHVDTNQLLYFKKNLNQKDESALRKLILKEIKVISPFDIENSKIFNPIEFGEDIDLNEDIVEGSFEIKEIKNKINYYSAQVSTENPRLLFLKKAYAPNWNVYINNIPAKNLKVSPYFNAVLVPEGEHFIEYKFQKRFYEKLLLFIAVILFSINIFIIILIRKRKF